MATARPFAYNLGPTIPGTEQLGDLSIGAPLSGFTDNPQFWNGPDEDLGYVIGYTVVAGDQPNPVGIPAYVQFWRSKFKTDESFIELSEFLSRKQGSPQTFATVDDAEIWLGNNGFWSSFTPPPTLTPTATVTSTPTNTPTVTSTPTPSVTPTNTPTPSSSPIPVTGYPFNLIVLPYNYPGSGNTIISNNPNPSGSTNPNIFAVGGSSNNGIYWSSIDSNGVDRTSYFSQFTGQSVTVTFNQTGSTAVYSGDSRVFQSWSGTVGDPGLAVSGSGFNFGAGIAQPGYSAGTATLIQSASTLWVTGVSVYISAVINIGTTPTPTPTNTTTPTNTLTPTTSPSSPTPTPTVTNTSTVTPTPSSSPTVTPTTTTTPTPSSTSSTSGFIVAAGGVNTIGYSSDGDSWAASSNSSTFLSQPALAVATNGTIFVAGGSIASNSLIYSTDGDVWSGSTNGATMFNTSVQGIGYGGGKFVAVGVSAGAAKIAYSLDGITWSAATNSNIFGSAPTAVAFNGSRWVATAQKGGGNTNTIAYSDDGITWSAATSSWTIFSTTARGIAWGDNRWVAVGDGTNRFAYSNDGITWSATTNGNSIITSQAYGIYYNGTDFVAGGVGTNTIAKSNDGLNWTGSTNGNSTISTICYCITWDGSKWIAGGLGTNQLATSADGLTWSATTNGNTVMSSRVRALAVRL